MKRRTFLKTALTASAALSLHNFAGENSHDSILRDAKERIQKVRRAPGKIVVKDQHGKPIPNAKVSVEQLNHDFKFGCNIFMFDRLGNAELDQIYRDRFASLLNYATLGFYWASYEPTQGRTSYEYTARVAQWCRSKNIICKGHPLAWDHYAGSPSWLPRDSSEIKRLSIARVHQCVKEFNGLIDIWDVVNEPADLTRFKTTMNSWATELGAIPFTKLHLQVAREANPSATLLVNDYRTDQAYHDILRALAIENHSLFDTIGIQSHMHDGCWLPSRVLETCDRFASFRKPIHFTETTLVSGPRLGPGENWGVSTSAGEEKQAESAALFYTLLFSHPSVEAITWWDLADRGAWQHAAAGLLRDDLSPKPIYEKLRSLIKGEWWTKSDQVTAPAGEVNLAAFAGRHKITVRLPNNSQKSTLVHWQKNSPNQFEISLT